MNKLRIYKDTEIDISDASIDVLAPANLLFTWVTGNNVIVNNVSGEDCVITSGRAEAVGDLPYTLPDGSSIEFYYDYGYKIMKPNELLSSQLNNIAKNANVLGLYPNVPNSNAKFSEILGTLEDGDRLYFPTGRYLFTPSPISISKKIEIVGQKKPYYDTDLDDMFGGAILVDCELLIETSNVNISDLGLCNKSVPNGIRIDTADSKDVIIDNLIIRPASHAVLIQNYGFEVKDIIVKNCKSFKGSHGFISKAKNIIFENCIAYNHDFNGIAIISDNQTELLASDGSNSKIINCETYECTTGISLYVRDYLSDNNSNNIALENIIILNCKTYNGDKGFAIGDAVDVTEGISLLPKNISIIDCKSTGNIGCMELNRVDTLIVDNFFVDTDIVSYNTSYLKLKNIKKMNLVSDVIDFNTTVILPQNVSSPFLKFGYKNFKTNNTTVGFSYYEFLGGNESDYVTIELGEIITELKTRGTIHMVNYSYFNSDSIATLKLVNGHWYEVGGKYRPKLSYYSHSLVTQSQIDVSKYQYIDISLGANTVNTIDFGFNLPFLENEITIILHSSGTFTYGGFSDRFMNVSTVPLSISSGSGLVLKFTLYNYKYYLTHQFSLSL